MNLRKVRSTLGSRTVRRQSTKTKIQPRPTVKTKMKRLIVDIRAGKLDGNGQSL